MAKAVKVTQEMIAEAMRKVDWAAQDRVTDAEIAAQIAEDPDLAPDLSGPEYEVAALLQRTRHKLGLSQTAFSARFHIPLRTLQEWEQARRQPDATAMAYLRVIEREPEAVARVLTAAE
ncbi:MAG TPA: transcriptional regulator [Crenalkalicoccus sp.]|jgi:putative transcriptional regulator|nr:transcriptional regulator [Crenalkalicoccus sp.]